MSGMAKTWVNSRKFAELYMHKEVMYVAVFHIGCTLYIFLWSGPPSECTNFTMPRNSAREPLLLSVVKAYDDAGGTNEVSLIRHT